MLTRRELLMRSGMGFGALACADLLGTTSPALASSLDPTAAKAPQFAPKAKRIIHLFMNGGPSHVDTFDPKPALQRYAGQNLPMQNLRTERKTGAAFPCPYRFRKYGDSGIDVSEIFPHVASCVDDMVVVRSMHADVPNHEPSLLLMNCGESRQVRPSMGSWLTYGLGSENANLPSFVAMCPGGYPIQESQNWQSGFLPGIFQGTYVDTQHEEIDKLIANIRNPRLSRDRQLRQLNLLRELNADHARQRDHDPQLESRIQSFELAFRMQTEAAEAFDVSRESESVRKLYGGGVQARQILIARRLVERGVRFVQVWHGAGQPWDNHDDIEVNHRRLAQQCDRAIGALLTDLKQRGMLEDTLVIWGGEFGRTPTVELPQKGANAGKINGRDHNHHGFTMWMAGGGVRAGSIYGATDEFGFRAVENRVHVHDLHATILKLMGFDHEQLTYRYAGRDFRLTDVHGNVVDALIG
ncbi:MAG: DUF1501 domain-containing protein [Planctomycetales bacterium]|nr:DUF1501 domain-containing protein [Planctomycetales bacterium]MCA9169830.1 DUF1501 domain-containing protein [Planctomycetales bacterium]